MRTALLAAPGSCIGANPATSKAGSCGCAASTDCGTVAQCNTNDKFCYWNHRRSVGQMKLERQRRNIVVAFPRPGRAGTSSGVAICLRAGGCNDSGQQYPPATLRQYRQRTARRAPVATRPTPCWNSPSATSRRRRYPGPDFYDISIINGINVAASFVPDGSFEADSSDLYSCAGPGSATQAGSLSPCSWQVNPTVDSVDYSSSLRNVRPATIATDGQCPTATAPPLGNQNAV